MFAQNLRTDDIAGEYTGHTGKYDFELSAETGDTLLIWYTLGTEQSPGIYVEVPSDDERSPGLAGAPGK